MNRLRAGYCRVVNPYNGRPGTVRYLVEGAAEARCIDAERLSDVARTLIRARL